MRGILLVLVACFVATGCAERETGGALSTASDNNPVAQTREEMKAEPVSTFEVGSSAACAQALPSVEPSRAGPGQSFRIYGGGFLTDCYDTGQPGQPPPERDIRIDFRQGKKTWKLAAVDADRKGIVNVELAVPKDARTGMAWVIVATGNGFPMEVPLRVLGAGSAAGPETPRGGAGPGVADGVQEAVAAACAGGGEALADVVVEGTVEKLTVRKNSSLAKVRVDRMVEGRARDAVRVEIASGIGAAVEHDPHLEEGERYLLYLRQQGDVFTTNECMGTRRLAE